MNEPMELLDQWWKDKLKLELAGQKYRIFSAFFNELQEARIALTMGDPDVKMAVDRIDRMMNIISEEA